MKIILFGYSPDWKTDLSPNVIIFFFHPTLRTRTIDVCNAHIVHYQLMNVYSAEKKVNAYRYWISRKLRGVRVRHLEGRRRRFVRTVDVYYFPRRITVSLSHKDAAVMIIYYEISNRV